MHLKRSRGIMCKYLRTQVHTGPFYYEPGKIQSCWKGSIQLNNSKVCKNGWTPPKAGNVIRRKNMDVLTLLRKNCLMNLYEINISRT